MVRLEEINGKNVRDILALRVSGNQESFVAPNDMSLIEAYIAVAHHGHAFPFGIYDDETPVGFCMVGFGADDDWEDAPGIAHGNYSLWRFMIAAPFQHRGYGKNALKLVLDFIATEPCGPAAYCWLSYEPENLATRALYASFGFQETGEWDGEEIIAALKLDKERPPLSVRYMTPADSAFWFSLDRHLSRTEYLRKVRDRMGYVLSVEGQPAAILRYSLFWDSIPFCNLLYVRPEQQRKGYGRFLMQHWEKDMKAKGYTLVMTSTQENEEAKFFYSAIGYRNCGELDFPFPGYEQPLELIFGKAL